MTNNIFNWIFEHRIEIIGAISGLIFVYLEIKQNIWLWPLGLITSAFYIYIFFISKFYADMGLQVYYLTISLYGWYTWTKGKNPQDHKKMKISKITTQLSLTLFTISVFLYALLIWILINFTDSPLPYWDAFTTALSITATWMLARKILEHWLIWIIVNIISLGLYFYKELYPTSILFLVYATMSVIGYIKWKKEMNQISWHDNKLTNNSL